MPVVDDAGYNRFTSARAVYSVLEENFLGVLESPSFLRGKSRGIFFLSRRMGTLIINIIH